MLSSNSTNSNSENLMSITSLFRATAVALALASSGGLAQAASIISTAPTFAPDEELITFDAYDGLLVSGTPIYLDTEGDVLFTATDAVLGQFAQDLGGNGLWGARDTSTSTTGNGNFLAGYSSMLFNFGADGPMGQVGAYFNVSQPLEGPKFNEITLTAYGESFEVLETFVVPISTDSASYNDGLFLGFARTSADIFNFGVTANGGATIVMDDLHLTLGPVPEPEGVLLMLAGLATIAAMTRRRRSNAQTSAQAPA
jgi:hypothetical protein